MQKADQVVSSTQALMRTTLTVLIALFFFSTPATAQNGGVETRPELPIAWAPLYPMVYAGQNGEATGFMVDLAQELGREIGFEPAFFRVENFSDWAAAQRSGASILLPAASTDLPFNDTNVFSKKVLDAEVTLAVRSSDLDDFDVFNLEGLRIGTLVPGAGSNPTLYPDAQMVNFQSMNDALIALLAGEIDALSTTSLYVYSAIRKAGIDYRIGFSDPPILQSGRHVAIHQSRIDLLEPINLALSQMEADGRLAALFSKHNVVIPESAPDVLKAGVTHFPPYAIQNADGTFSGFGVETFADLAELAGLTIEFIPIETADIATGPTAQTYDVLPQIGINPERREIMDFTLPLLTNTSSIYTSAGKAGGLSNLDSLVGRTVGVESVNTSRRLAENHGALTLSVITGRSALLQALAEGSVDAILFTTNAMRAEIEAQGLADEIEEVTPPFYVATRAPGLRVGLGDVRERLNAVIPGYLISNEYEALQEKYFGEPVFWTPLRINLALGILSVNFLVLLGYIVWQRMQQRRQAFERQKEDLERERAYAAEQDKLVKELERSNRDLDEFAYIASHDMKEPLRGIGINANFLMREELPEKAKKRAVRMAELTGRMENLISDLLYFSRLGRGGSSPVTVQPSKVIDGIRSDLMEWLDETDGEIIQVGEIPTLKAQRIHVKTVLQNLITNAIKYNDSPVKRVELGFLRRVEMQDEVLEDAIFVRDNGIGIEERYREKIFRIFSRLNKESDYATSTGSGTGSGLAFTRKIVEQYGGVVKFEAHADGGTIFYVTLPLATTDELSRMDEGR